MQRLYNASSWTEIGEGRAIVLPGVRPRKVVLEVNAPNDTRLHLYDGDGQMTFLALVRGRDRLEFECEGERSLTADNECYVITADGQTVHAVIEAPEPFIRVMERRVRNHELERAVAAMNYHAEERMRRMEAEIVRRYEAREAARAAESQGSGDAGGAGGEPAPAGDGSTSDQAAE